MAFKMKGFSPFTRKTDPVKKPVGPVAPSDDEYILEESAEKARKELWEEVKKGKRTRESYDAKMQEVYNYTDVQAAKDYLARKK